MGSMLKEQMFLIVAVSLVSRMLVPVQSKSWPLLTIFGLKYDLALGMMKVLPQCECLKTQIYRGLIRNRGEETIFSHSYSHIIYCMLYSVSWGNLSKRVRETACIQSINGTALTKLDIILQSLLCSYDCPCSGLKGAEIAGGSQVLYFIYWGLWHKSWKTTGLN